MEWVGGVWNVFIDEGSIPPWSMFKHVTASALNVSLPQCAHHAQSATQRPVAGSGASSSSGMQRRHLLRLPSQFLHSFPNALAHFTHLPETRPNPAWQWRQEAGDVHATQ